MNIPQVNATVTDRNREQTKRICGLRGWYYSSTTYKSGIVSGWVQAWAKDCNPHTESAEQTVYLPSGSFTLCQVVGMLGAEGGFYSDAGIAARGWWCPRVLNKACACETADPHDLTAAMDALIKVLEAKP